MFEFMSTKWPRAFMLVAILQLVLCLVFEIYVFAQFQIGTNDDGLDETTQTEVRSQFRTIPTFLALFIFGFIYEIVLVWDALRMKNTIQIIIICIANLAFLVFSALQIDQIMEAIHVINKDEPVRLLKFSLWNDLRPFLLAMPCVIGLAFAIMCFISWKLYQDFAWDILKHIGADYRMKKRFLHYQIYIALLKFDFFFFLGFIVQFVVVVADKDDPEFALTIVTIPITILILLAAAFFTRRENKAGMVGVIILYLGGLSYFIFKLVRIYQPGHKQNYEAVRRSLTAFAVITILLILLTIVNAVVCMLNFGKGLKPHLQSLSRKRKVEEKPDVNSINMQDVKPQIPSRMTID